MYKRRERRCLWALHQLAEGTTSVELASRAEKPQGETGQEFEMLLREGKRKVDLLPQGSSDEGWAQDAASEQAQT